MLSVLQDFGIGAAVMAFLIIAYTKEPRPVITWAMGAALCIVVLLLLRA